MKAWCQRLAEAPLFQHAIMALIVMNAVTIGLETYPYWRSVAAREFYIFNQFVLAVYVFEALVKMIAVSPRVDRYFRDRWNLFDFTIILLCFIPATGNYATMARLVRLLRVMRLVSAFPELRLIVATLFRSLPGMGNIAILMGIIFYMYGIIGYHMLHDVDPFHWGTLGDSLLTLFRIVTLEDWTDVMYTAMETYRWSWVYFVSFIIFGTFVVINLFIAVVINSLDEAKKEQLYELTLDPSTKQMVMEMKETQTAIEKLQIQLDKISRDVERSS